jgi:pyruvate formate lyase activating enzyme
MGAEFRLAGDRMSVQEVFDKIKSYEVFYKNSNGGVTLSGGEPLVQDEFVREFTALCLQGGLSIGLETCGYFQWDKVKDFIHKFDFIYYDIKLLDPNDHERMTGKDNRIILENLKKLSGIIPEKITVTIPVIKDINSSAELMDEIAGLCNSLKITRVKLLPYHAMGTSKYEELGRAYKLKATAPRHSEIEELKNIFEDKGLKCFISID